MFECFGVFSEVTSSYVRCLAAKQRTGESCSCIADARPRQTVVIFDPSVPGAPAAAINGNDAEPARDCIRQSNSLPGGETDRPPTEAASPELHREEPPFGQAGVSTDPFTQPRSCDGRPKLLLS